MHIARVDMYKYLYIKPYNLECQQRHLSRQDEDFLYKRLPSPAPHVFQKKKKKRGGFLANKA